MKSKFLGLDFEMNKGLITFTLICSMVLVGIVGSVSAETTIAPLNNPDLNISELKSFSGGNDLIYGDGRFLSVWNKNPGGIVGRFISLDGTLGTIFTIDSGVYQLIIHLLHTMEPDIS